MITSINEWNEMLKESCILEFHETYKPSLEPFKLNEKVEVSNELKYHLDKNLCLMNSTYRIGSSKYASLIREARKLFKENKLSVNEDDAWILNTEAGEIAQLGEAQVILDIPFYEPNYVNEAEYKGKDVDLNSPFRTPGGPKKFSVYVKNDKGNVVKVNFGDPNSTIKNGDPVKAKAFRARHGCDNPGPKWKAKYWSCNVARYAKQLGLSSSRPW